MFARNCARGLTLASLLLVPALMTATLPASAAELPNIGLLQGPGLSGAVLDLYLEVRLNGVGLQRVMQVAADADGRHYAWSGNLRDSGLRLDALPADTYLDLATISGLRYRIDMPNQRIDFDADAARLDRSVQSLNADPVRTHPASSAPGLLLNYDLYASAGLQRDGSRSFSGLTELRGFGDWGVFSSTGLSSYSDTVDDRAYTRLDSRWSRSFQDRLTTLNVGDFIGGSVGWSRPTRLGGVQLRRNFSLQPELITFPLPAFFGEAALPSSVELYVNGIRQYRGEVAPGPFQLYTMPGINGAGQAQVIVTDALGRRSAISFPYYNSSQLLKAGLSDWSLEIGALRRGFGQDSFDYGSAPVASGSLRYGLREWLTLETHAEAVEGLYLAGVGSALRLGRAGVLSGSYAHSDGETAGDQAGVGYSWLQDRVNLDLALSRSFGSYRDVASLESRAPPRRSERANVGYNFGAAGSVSLNYTRLDTEEDGRQRFLGAGYSLNLPRSLGFFFSATRSLDDAAETSLFAGLSWSFAAGVSASTTYQRQDGKDLFGADLVRGQSFDGGFGWNLRTQQGGSIEAYQGEASYRGDYGQLLGGATSVDGQQQAYAGYSGALVLMDRALFVSRRIDDAFALVSTNGVPEVPVFLENRPIGRTDARGHYLLGNLNAWQPNRVSIDALQLPAQMRVGSVDAEAVPRDRGAVLVSFSLVESRSVIVELRDSQGQPLPLGSRVQVDAADATPAMVGYDGQVFLEQVPRRTRLSVRRPDGGQCEALLLAPERPEGIPLIGPLECRQEDR